VHAPCSEAPHGVPPDARRLINSRREALRRCFPDSQQCFAWPESGETPALLFAGADDHDGTRRTPCTLQKRIFQVRNGTVF
jgi:hypothetical protein